MGLKRKLEGLVQDERPPLSAFAAAKGYQVAQLGLADNPHGTLDGKYYPKLTSNGIIEDSESANQAIAGRTAATATEDVVDLDYDSEAGMDNSDLETPEATNGPEFNELPVQEFSSWKPLQNNVSSTTSGQRIHMNYGQTLAILGQFDLKAHSGVISIYGTFLTNQSSIQRIIAPLTEPMPVIRCVSSDGAIIDLLNVSANDSYENLGRVSSLFRDIWTCTCPNCSEVGSRLTFRKILDSKDLCSRHYIPALDYPTSWQRTTAKLCDDQTKKHQVIAVAGSLRSGKSTFSRFLANKLLTPKVSDEPLVAFMDLDPDRPDVALPGHIGLYFLERPLLQASFSRQRLHEHPWDTPIYVGTASSSFNELAYLAAVTELFRKLHSEHAKNYSGTTIVHCPGWYKGSGNTTFIKILEMGHFTDMVCLSDSPNIISNAIRNANSTPNIHTLNSYGLIPSQSIRTHPQLLDMSIMAHFHSQNRSGNKLDLTPISSWRPWTVSFHQSSLDFRGVYFMNGLPPLSPNFLTQILNGSLVSVAVVDDDYMLPETQLGVGDGIPYFAAGSDEYSDIPHPSEIRTIGILLIRSIDVNNKIMMCLNCPGLSQYPKARVIVIAGGLEAPGWAYTEDLEYREYAKQTANENASSYLVKGAKEYPWVASVTEKSVS